LIEFEGINISEALGKIEIEMNQQSSKKNKEATQVAIQEMSQIDFLKINEWLVNPSSQFQVTVQEVKKIQDKLPQIQKKMFVFELNERIEPSRFIVALMDRCTQCIEHGKSSVVGENKKACTMSTSSTHSTFHPPTLTYLVYPYHPHSCLHSYHLIIRHLFPHHYFHEQLLFPVTVIHPLTSQH
jgi:hypothetical protein